MEDPPAVRLGDDRAVAAPAPPGDSGDLQQRAPPASRGVTPSRSRAIAAPPSLTAARTRAEALGIDSRSMGGRSVRASMPWSETAIITVSVQHGRRTSSTSPTDAVGPGEAGARVGVVGPQVVAERIPPR
ncbi:MAG TPA: hypothetical protein VJT32_16795 [bacterium]|nr:hypothetical protein [bacterium]